MEILEATRQAGYDLTTGRAMGQCFYGWVLLMSGGTANGSIAVKAAKDILATDQEGVTLRKILPTATGQELGPTNKSD